VIGYLPGKDYGTPQDQQILLSTHTDAMSLVEEDGAFGMLGFVTPADAPMQRSQLVREYEQAFHAVEGGRYSDAQVKLQKLAQDIEYFIRDPNQTALSILVNAQIGKLAGL